MYMYKKMVFLMYVCGKREWMTSTLFTPRVYKPGPRRTPGKETKFLSYGFAYLQDMVEHAIIKLQTGSDKDVGVMVEQFPYPCYIRDS